MKAYTNANWAESVTNHKSTSTYILRGNLVIWRSKKQVVVAKSNSTM